MLASAPSPRRRCPRRCYGAHRLAPCPIFLRVVLAVPCAWVSTVELVADEVLTPHEVEVGVETAVTGTRAAPSRPLPTFTSLGYMLYMCCSCCFGSRKLGCSTACSGSQPWSPIRSPVKPSACCAACPSLPYFDDYFTFVHCNWAAGSGLGGGGGGLSVLVVAELLLLVCLFQVRGLCQRRHNALPCQGAPCGQHQCHLLRRVPCRPQCSSHGEKPFPAGEGLVCWC